MKILTIGILLIILGILFMLVGTILSVIKTPKNIESAGGIFIGPIPIFGFASSKRMFYILVIFAILLFILHVILKYTK